MTADRFTHDPLASAIRETLLVSPDLLKSDYRDSPMPYAGHCYVATQAYYYMRGGVASGLRPTVIQHEGGSHWYLVGQGGGVIDLTAEQFRTPVPYETGRGCGFSHRDQTQPDKRSQACIERTLRAHPELLGR